MAILSVSIRTTEENLTDREYNLIKRCQEGDDSAFGELIDSYNDKAFSIAYGVMGNHHDAADMAQEAFVKVYRNIGKFNFKSSFGTWFYRIVKNTCIDELRRQKRNRVISLDAEIEGEDGDYKMQVADDKEDIQTQLEKKETKEMLWAALEMLSEKHRAVLVLADIKGFDYLEIADMLDMPVGTVKSRIFRAREKLEAILQNMGTF